MKSLADLGKKAVADETLRLLKVLFTGVKQEIQDNAYELDTKRGIVTIEFIEFTYSDKALRMMGYCPVCGMEVISSPLRRFADIGDQLSSFKPGRHQCLDV